MKVLLQWLWSNGQWIFSGIGVPIIVAIWMTLWRKRRRRASYPSISAANAVTIHIDGETIVSKSLISPVSDRLDDRSVLRSFSRDFLDHSSTTTHLVDYIAWHESDEDWREGNGLLSTATYGEIPHFWARPEHFAIFEARLLRYLRSGGDTRRVFVLGPEIRTDATLLLLYRTLKRHEALGFHPHVHSVLDLHRAVRALNIACDMFASFNGRIAYFLHCPADHIPTMVRSIEAVTASKTQNLLMRLWHASSPASEFFARHSLEIPDELNQTIRRDIETIEDMAFKPTSSG